MRVLFAVVVVLGSAGLVAAQEKKDGKKYESKAGAYAVAFPDKPRTQTSKAGGAELNLALVASGETVYLVTYTDLPAGDGKKDRPKDLLARGELGLTKSLGVKVTASKDTEFGPAKHPARELSGEKGPTHYRVLVVVAGDRVYSVIVMGKKELTTGKEADAFFKSFEITK